MSSTYKFELLTGMGLSESCALQILPRVRMTGFDPQEIVWSKGSGVAAWTYIVSGLVGASVPIQEGGSIHVDIYGNRTWFGEEALLNRYPSSFEYVCLTPVRTVEIPAADVLAAFQREPEFARYVALLMAWRSRRSAEMAVLMKQGSPALRVVMPSNNVSARSANCCGATRPSSPSRGQTASSPTPEATAPPRRSSSPPCSPCRKPRCPPRRGCSSGCW